MKVIRHNYIPGATLKLLYFKFIVCIKYKHLMFSRWNDNTFSRQLVLDAGEQWTQVDVKSNAN